MHLLLASVRAMLTDSDCVCVRVTSMTLTMCVVAAFALRLVNDISVLSPQAGPGPGPPPPPPPPPQDSNTCATGANLKCGCVQVARRLISVFFPAPAAPCLMKSLQHCQISELTAAYFWHLVILQSTTLPLLALQHCLLVILHHWQLNMR